MDDLPESFSNNLPRVWIIADRGTFDDAHLLATLDRLRPMMAAHPGVVGVIERDHTGSPDAVRFARIGALKALLGPVGVPVWVNRRIDLALAAGADGVQLTSFGLSATVASQHFPILPLAVSCHNGADLAAATGARFALLSPFANPTSKPPTRPPLGVDGWRALTAGQNRPIIALGGIDPHTAALAMTAGAAGVATVGGVLGASDPSEALQALVFATRPQNPGPRSSTGFAGSS